MQNDFTKQKESKGISATDYHSLLKDISQIYEVSLSDGTENWNKTALFYNRKFGKVLSEGIFLNNELLDDGFAVLV